MTNPKLDNHELSEGVTLLFEMSLANKGLAGRVDHESVTALSRELAEGIRKGPLKLSTNHSQTSVQIPERTLVNTITRIGGTPDIHTR